MMDDMSLNALGILCGTDKSDLGYGYLRHYERALAGFRDLPMKTRASSQSLTPIERVANERMVETEHRGRSAVGQAFHSATLNEALIACQRLAKIVELLR